MAFSQSPVEAESSKLLGADTKTPSAAEETPKKKKALLSKSMLCKLLAEFIRSYAGVAKLVTDHQYAAGINEKITEVRLVRSSRVEGLVAFRPPTA